MGNGHSQRQHRVFSILKMSYNIIIVNLLCCWRNVRQFFNDSYALLKNISIRLSEEHFPKSDIVPFVTTIFTEK
jgi:hypothetical protein